MTLVLALMAMAAAHDVRPGVVALREVEGGVYELRVTPAQDGGTTVVVRPQWPAGCAQRGDQLSCPGGLAGEVGVSTPGDGVATVVVHARWLDGRVEQQLIAAGGDRAVIGRGRPLSTSAGVRLGFDHVLAGLDHVLFVCGLMLLCRAPRALIGAVTAFTVAHSATLGLAAMGWVTAPALAIELLIALSLVLVAREALSSREGWARRAPWLVAGGFGLVHGIGFAGALLELGLPPGARLWTLLSFNVGVELAQLAVLAGAGLVAWLWSIEANPLRRWGRVAAAYAVGLPAGVWTVRRGWAWVWLVLFACGDKGDDPTDSAPHTGGPQVVELSRQGTACLYGDGAPATPNQQVDTTFTADAPVDASVVLESCATGCATDVTASCEVRLVTGEVVVTATGSYTVPGGNPDCPSACVEIAATCTGEPLSAGKWTLDYEGGHSDAFEVPGTSPAPCATAL